MFVENIRSSDKIFAIILHREFYEEGIHFFTPDEFSHQLGYMSRPEGYIIPPHTHNSVSREVLFTNEVLFIKSGRVRVDFYDDHQNYRESRVLQSNDVILLASGGHGFEMLEASEIIEVKQGPYVGEFDKTRFNAVEKDRIIFKVPNEF